MRFATRRDAMRFGEPLPLFALMVGVGGGWSTAPLLLRFAYVFLGTKPPPCKLDEKSL